MKKLYTFLVLFTLGIFLSTQLMSQSGDVVTLTEDNHIVFSGVVDDTSVAKAQLALGQISANLGKKEVIYLVIDSPGGSVSAGNLFIDFAKSLPQKIKPICIFCASMGYHIFQSLDERLVYNSSELMSHRVRIGGLAGQVPGEAISRLNNIIAVSNKMDESVAKRIGLTLEAYQNLIYDELWLDGTNAVKLKHADRIAKIKCSESLMTKTKSQSVDTFFGPVEVKMSKCPLINGALGFEFKREAFRSLEEVKTLVRRAKRTQIWNY